MRGGGALPQGHPISREPCQGTAVVVALVGGAVERARLRDSLRGRAIVHFVDRAGELTVFFAHRAEAVDALVVQAFDKDGRFTGEIITALRRACPEIPIVGYCRVGGDQSGTIRELVMAGAHELLFHGVDDSGVALRSVLASAERVNVGDIVAAALCTWIPAPLHALVSYVTAHPESSDRVSRVAKALGVHRKTLVNQCARGRMPSPQQLIAWCRLAVAGRLLGTTAKTVETIALQLDFPSDTALRNMLKRYTGLTASQIRAEGGLPCVVAAFRREWERHHVGEITQDPTRSSTLSSDRIETGRRAAGPRAGSTAPHIAAAT